jgi:LacI family transcriptional regulator
MVHMAKVRLQDVADRSGVSIATISRIINSPDQVHPDTRAKVYQVMEELGYKKDLREKPRSRGKGAIAVITPHSDSEFFTEFVAALFDYFTEDRIYPLIVHTRGERTLSVYLEQDTSWVNLVDGVVAFFCDIDDQARAFLTNHRLPTVVVHARTSYFYSVMNNDYLGGFDAAAHLWSRGYRYFRVVSWGTDDSKIRDRVTGFTTFLKDQNYDMDSSRIITTQMSIKGGYQATAKLLEGGLWGSGTPLGSSSDPKPKPCIFYTSDTMAIGGLKYCWEQGIKIPQEIGIMGYDDIRIAQAMNLTTMKQFIPAKAKAVWEYFYRNLGVVPLERVPEEITFTPVAIPRGTT